MGENPRTTIQISDGTADELHEMKDRGESYDDVIQRLLRILERSDRPAEA